MTDSTLQVPSFGRMIAELDGSYPGVSMFDIAIKRTRWNSAAKKYWKDKSYEHLLFEGTGDNFKMSYHAARWLKGESFLDGFDFCRISNLKYTHVADERREFPRMTIEVQNCLQNFGASDVRIVAAYGPDFSVPVWGLNSERNWPGSFPELANSLTEWRTRGKFDPLALTKTEGGQMFLARLALELGIGWTSRDLSITFATAQTTSEGFARVIDRGIQRPG